jgi:flagellar basal body-associated protein FliL
MKVQESLSQYLYETKKLTLPGIGHFSLDPSVNVYEKSDPTHLQQAIQYIPDTSSKDDPDLINHLVKTTGKMKPLAISDLDSYLSTGKQLLNIGKPFIIPGIGSLNKTREGIEFTAGQFVPPKIEDKVTEHKLRDKTVEEPNFSSIEKEFDYDEGSRKTSKRWLMLLATVLVLATAGWGVYYFLIAEKNTTIQHEVTADTTGANDTTQTILPVSDTVALKKDSLIAKPTAIAAIPDSIVYTYAVLLRQYNYAKSANDRIAVLKTYKHKIFLEVQVHWPIQLK